MAAGSDFNNHHFKQQSQYLQMRGAQIAEQQAGQKTELGSPPRAAGSRRQLIGTVVGVVLLLAALMILSRLGIL